MAIDLSLKLVKQVTSSELGFDISPYVSFTNAIADDEQPLEVGNSVQYIINGLGQIKQTDYSALNPDTVKKLQTKGAFDTVQLDSATYMSECTTNLKELNDAFLSVDALDSLTND
jgi:hypothetical protein